jgi:hypothetical protein
MTLPPARVAGAEPPIHARPGVRRLVKAVATTAGVAVLWLAARSCLTEDSYGLRAARDDNNAEAYRRYASRNDPDDVRDDLSALHDLARRYLRSTGARPQGLDSLLLPLRARVDNRILLDGTHWQLDAASFAALDKLPADLLAPHYPGALDQLAGAAELAPIASYLHFDRHCARGFDAAFAAVTDADVITFVDRSFGSDAPADTPRVELRVVVRASGTVYQGGISRRIVPGIRMVGEVVLIGEAGELGRVPVDLAPPDEVHFTTLGPSLFNYPDTDVGAALVTTVCTQAALALATALDGAAPTLAAIDAKAKNR